MYNLIGFITAGSIASLGMLIWGLLLQSLCVDYVTEEPNGEPAGVKLASKIMSPFKLDVDSRHLAFLTGLILVCVSMVCFKLWPIVIIGLFGYIMLRAVRFGHRIKRSITGLVSKKKCLKEYSDDEMPKSEF